MTELTDINSIWLQIAQLIDAIDNADDEEERMDLRAELARLELKLSRIIN